MMKRRLIFVVLALIFAFALVGCQESTGTDKKGARLSSITIIGVEENAALMQLEAGEIDLYAGTLPGEYLDEIEEAGLEYCKSTGMNYEIMLNNADTVQNTGLFNPFSIREVREALNWLIDRDYICQEIFGGAAIPRIFPVGSASPDYSRYIELARAVEARYTYDKDQAITQIDQAMTDAGIEKDAEGKWSYEGEPITLKFYIRTEDGIRQQMGDYVANQLEEAGFTVERLYKEGAEAGPVVGGTDPSNGEWHLFTSAWDPTGLDREAASYFQVFSSPNSPLGFMAPWQAFKISDEYEAVLTRLTNSDYTTLEERAELFKQAFDESCYWSTRIWIADALAYTPWDSDVSTSYNLSAGVGVDQMTAYTLGFNDKEGGDLVWANSSPPLIAPVNPRAGSSFSYDLQYQNLTQDYAVIADPYTGLRYPKRIEKADVVIQKGLPVEQTYDWVNLSFEEEIKVPEDALIDWDVESSTWIMADGDYISDRVAKAEEALSAAKAAAAEAGEEEKATADAVVASAKQDLEAAQAMADKGYLTARRKTVMYYGKDLKDFTWHDGTPVTLADIMMQMIMDFETAKEESPLFDPYIAASFQSTLPYFKGWRIVSEDPIVIEIYSDSYTLDAENNVSEVEMGWTHSPSGSQGSWHGVAVSNRVILDGKATYSEGMAAESDTIEWLNWLDGPCLDLMETATQQALDGAYIPFAATMGKYVSEEEAKKAYQNTLDFYQENGHFYIGNGPYYISDVLSTEGAITLMAYDKYKEPVDRWAFLCEPKLATVDVDGPTSVKSDAEAVFEVSITDPAGEDYSVADIAAVKYLLFDSSGEIVEVEAVESKKDGLYTITLSAEQVGELGIGACKIEVVVSPRAVAAPSIVSYEFVVE